MCLFDKRGSPGLALVATIAGLLCGCNAPVKNLPISAYSPPKSNWWSLFDEPQLDCLMARIKCENLQLRSIEADWNADHLGRVRHAIGGVKADLALAEQVNELKLTLQSQLAQSYFRLLFVDEEKRILEKALETREENLELATERFESGLTGELDVTKARADLSTIKADLARMSNPRTQLENAIAVLVGDEPSCIEIDTSELPDCLPIVNGCVPVSVLGNRPDVVAAISRLKIANSRLGLEKAKVFPDADLVGCCVNFLDWSRSNLEVCPEETCFVVRGRYQKNKLKGRYVAQVKALLDYQKTMQAALREVGDILGDLAGLDSERDAHLLSIEASEKTAELVKEQYDEGVTGSTELSNAESGKLAAERRLVQIRSQQYVATVKLLEALGGRCAKDHFSK